MISARTMGRLPYPGRSVRKMLLPVGLDLCIEALAQEIDDGALQAAVHGGPDGVVEARNPGVARLFLQGQHRPAVLLVDTEGILHAIRLFEALPVHAALQRVGMHGTILHGYTVAVARRGLGGRIQKDTLVVHGPGAAHLLRRLEEPNHGRGLLREPFGYLLVGIANKIPPLSAKELTLGLREIPHDAVHVGGEAFDVPARHDAPAVATGRATLLDDYIADERGGEDPAIHQDTVDFDEALRKGSHDWSYSIHPKRLNLVENFTRYPLATA